MKASTWRNMISTLKPTVAIAAGIGGLIGGIYAILIWLYRDQLVPEKLGLATIAGFSANILVAIIYILYLARIKKIIVSIMDAVEINLVQLIAYMVAALVVYNMLLD